MAAVPVPASPSDAADPITFTVLHTNDFHGNLELSGSNPGAARVAQKVADVRTAVGADNVLLLDAGDMMQGSLLSNLSQGLATIDYYRTIGYDAATFGNHEFDWGQTVLGDRIAQAEAAAIGDESPMQLISANVTKKVAGSCTWDPLDTAVTPYEVFPVGTAPNQVRVGVIGVGSVETPYITKAEATDGLCFRDPFESIDHYYDALAAASDVQIVLSHNGYTDGGYGYGFPVYGDQTLAKKLNDAAKPVDLIIGGHSHTDVSAPTMVGSTAVVQAHYAGRKVGRADITYNPDTKVAGVSWSRIVVGTADPEYSPVQAEIAAYATDPDYVALIGQPVGYTQVDLGRNGNGDSMMGSFVNDAIYGWLHEDASPDNDVDLFLNNPGGIRADWCDKEDPPGSDTYVWSSSATDCAVSGVWEHDPMLLTYGETFQILPFGNVTIVGTMTGAQLQELLNQSATLFKGALQPAGVRYKLYRYADGPSAARYTWAWGAYDIEVRNGSGVWEPLDLTRTYKVGTNEYLAPAGQDGFTPFKYMTDITYWGDMLNAVNAYVSAHYTLANPYRGPNGDGTLDGRITRDGNGDDSYDAGEIVPVTILHHNDSHGRLLKSGSFQGYDQLATVIKQARAHNPDRTLLLTSGDNLQGDSMMYYFKSAGLGYSADGTALPADLQINPLIKAFNSMGYDAWTLGNHEFNFGKDVFGTLAQADFPILQANVSDTGEYGLEAVGVQPYTTKTVGPEGIKVAILGIGNHRVPSYELPSNIPGLTFTDPIATAQGYTPTLQAENDAVIALTHIGFTEDAKSVEVDTNVDTYFATQVTGVDAVIGGHSHTNPVSGFGAYKYLPAIVAGPGNVPVPVTQAYRYNTNLGEIVLGLLPDGAGGWKTVARAGRYTPVSTSTAQDAQTVALVQPYQALINAYNNTVIGSTTVPIDTNQAFTSETNGANLQADASVWALEQQGIDVDVHLSGAMTNRLIANTATEANPYSLKVSDMFAAMPYENSLVVMEMNGPQLKAVLERAYRNYYYYKYVPGYGGYSYYTTCMLDTDSLGRISYRDGYPAIPNGDNVADFAINGEPVDFGDAATYYRVSTVNYLAAGACNFSNAGVTLWPLDQIVADTQYYVRDVVIDYITAQTGPVSPAVEGRLQFSAPAVSTPVLSAEPSVKDAAVIATATFTDPGGPGSFSATVDYGDGSGWLPATVTGSTASGPSHTYSDIGSYRVQLRVTRVGGGSASASTTHVVRFALGPVSMPGDRLTAKAGSALPVAFSLGGYQGMSVFAAGYPKSYPSGAAPATATSTKGVLSYSDGRYTYVWRTDKSWSRTTRTLVLRFTDGNEAAVQVEFTK